jgi:regulator of RNase E activity RraA
LDQKFWIKLYKRKITVCREEKMLTQQKLWESIRIANLYDTLDEMGYPNQCIDLGIKPLFPQLRMAGVAVTVRGARTPYTVEELKSHKEKIDFEDLLPYIFPGTVVVVDGGGEKLSGKFGEMTSWALQQRGAKGIVIDGYIRDYPGLKEILLFTACARGTSPIESDKRWAIQEINAPIGMPGTLTNLVRVTPGDWILGGSDGVIVVPKEIAAIVLTKALDIETREEGMRQDLAAGVDFKLAYTKWGRS